MPKVLISGGSGLVGSRLTDLLLDKGYEVIHLGRQAKQGKITTYAWNINEGRLDPNIFADVDHVVHLAGAGVADKSWSVSRKKELHDSRVMGTQLLIDAMSWQNKKPKSFITASAIGYYGDAGKQLCTEEQAAGNGFLAKLCVDWEQSAQAAAQFTRLCSLRIGIVLSSKGGALPKMMLPFKFFAGAVLGSGKQMMSWVHIDDLCRMFIHLIENENCNGVYNGVAPLPVSHFSFMRAVGKVMQRPLWMWVPSFVLRLVLGEMADTVLKGQLVSNEKIQQSGFRCQYGTVYQALQQCIKT